LSGRRGADGGSFGRAAFIPAVQQLRLDIDEEIIVDGFAGAGGMSEAIYQAYNRHPFAALNHSADALSCHAVNHRCTNHWLGDIREACPHEVTQGRPVGLLHLSPDCFPAGTMVLAREGYRRIEELSVGDEVLTHKLRWRKVTETMRTVRPLLKIRGQGHPGLVVSPEHPFFARERRDVWQTEPRGYLRTLEPAKWIKAGELNKGAYWASPGEFPAAEAPAVPVYRGRTMRVDADLMWLAGLYVADGWSRIDGKRAELVITCGKREAEKLRSMLNRWPREGCRSTSDELAWTERETGTAYQFTAAHRGLVEWLRSNFGHGAAEKLIPGWALGLDASHREALLSGYLVGDGCSPLADGSPLVICTTVSKALAFGIKALATSLGHAPAICPGLLAHELAAAKDGEIRDAAHGVSTRQRRMGFGIDLEHECRATEFLGGCLDLGRTAHAGPAPGRPEIDEYGQRRGRQDRVELRFIHVQGLAARRQPLLAGAAASLITQM
jgi:hypothetical protein